MKIPDIRQASKIAIDSKTKSIFFRYKYIFDDLSIYDPVITVVSDYKSYIIANSLVEKLKEKHYQRPDLFCYDKYGSVELWYVILTVNDIPSVTDFVVENIFVPPIDILYDVLKEYIPDTFRSIYGGAIQNTLIAKKEVLKN